MYVFFLFSFLSDVIYVHVKHKTYKLFLQAGEKKGDYNHYYNLRRSGATNVVAFVIFIVLKKCKYLVLEKVIIKNLLHHLKIN